MTLLSESKNLIESLEKIKENLGLNNKTISGGLFNSLEVKRGSVDLRKGSIGVDPQTIISKPKKYYFRISFLKGAIQFLDLKSTLNLSLVNKEFNYFIKSIYFYKFMTNVRNSRRKNTKTNKKEKENETPTKDQKKIQQAHGGFMGNLVGAIGSIGTGAIGSIGSVFGISSKKDPKSEKVIDPKLAEEKINYYEKILKTKMKNLKMSNEIKELRENIDALILKRKVEREIQNKPSNSYHHLIKDEEIQQIKRDKIEKEYNELLKEVNSMKEEVNYLN